MFIKSKILYKWYTDGTAVKGDIASRRAADCGRSSSPAVR